MVSFFLHTIHLSVRVPFNKYIKCAWLFCWSSPLKYVTQLKARHSGKKHKKKSAHAQVAYTMNVQYRPVPLSMKQTRTQETRMEYNPSQFFLTHDISFVFSTNYNWGRDKRAFHTAVYAHIQISTSTYNLKDLLPVMYYYKHKTII